MKHLFLLVSLLSSSVSYPISLNNKAVRCLWQTAKMAGGTATTALGILVLTRTQAIQKELNQGIVELNGVKSGIKQAQDKLPLAQEKVEAAQNYLNAHKAHIDAALRTAHQTFEHVESHTPNCLKQFMVLALRTGAYLTPNFVKKRYNDFMGKKVRQTIEQINSAKIFVEKHQGKNLETIVSEELPNAQAEVEKIKDYAEKLKNFSPEKLDAKIEDMAQTQYLLGRARIPVGATLIATGLTTLYSGAKGLKNELAELAWFKPAVSNTTNTTPAA